MDNKYESAEALILNLLTEYVKTIREMDKIQAAGLAHGKEIKQNNRLADGVKKIASEIEGKYPELKPEFYQLLFNETASVRLWAAHHILEVMNYDDKYRRAARNEIVHISAKDKRPWEGNAAKSAV